MPAAIVLFAVADKGWFPLALLYGLAGLHAALSVCGYLGTFLSLLGVNSLRRPSDSAFRWILAPAYVLFCDAFVLRTYGRNSPNEGLVLGAVVFTPLAIGILSSLLTEALTALSGSEG